MKKLGRPARPDWLCPLRSRRRRTRLQYGNVKDAERKSSFSNVIDSEGNCSALANVGLSGLDKHKMKKKMDRKMAKLGKRLAASAAACEASTSADGAAEAEGVGGGTGGEGGPRCGWGAANAQEDGQVRVEGGLCSRINFRTATEYPPIHVLFSNKPSNASNASSSPFGPTLPLSPTPTLAAELMASD
jgi:hypothetical protein